MTLTISLRHLYLKFKMIRNSNTSTTTNIVSEESPAQSRGRCLKLQSDRGTQETLSSTGRLKRALAQPPRFKIVYLQIGATAFQFSSKLNLKKCDSFVL